MTKEDTQVDAYGLPAGVYDQLPGALQNELSRLLRDINSVKSQLRQAGLLEAQVEVKPSRTPEEISAERQRRVAGLDPSRAAKAIWVVGDGETPLVGVWHPDALEDGFACAVVCGGIMPSKKFPDKLSARKVYSGEQPTPFGPALSDLLATVPPATEEQWTNLMIHTRMQAIRKDAPLKPKKKAARKPDASLDSLL